MRNNFLRVIIIICLLGVAHVAFAAIAFDAGDTLTTATNATSVTFSHTIGAGSNMILFVASLTTGNDASATYNGVSMTKVSSQVEANDSRALSLFVLPNPTAGAHNIIISVPAQEALLRGWGSSYSGALQSTIMDASSTAHDDTNVSFFIASTTTNINNDWAVLVGRQTGGTNPGGIQASSSVTFRTNDVFDAIGDTNSPITPAGLKAMTVAASSTGVGGFYTIMAAFGPASLAPTTHLLRGSGITRNNPTR